MHISHACIALQSYTQARYPKEYIYEPWKAPLSVQRTCGCILGEHYPLPILDHSTASKINLSRMKAAYDAHNSAAAASVVDGARVSSSAANMGDVITTVPSQSSTATQKKRKRSDDHSEIQSTKKKSTTAASSRSITSYFSK